MGARAADDGLASTVDGIDGIDGVDGVGGQVTSVHHVNLVISVGGVARAVDFYDRVLGFRVLTKLGSGEGGAWLRAGDVELHLSEREGAQHPDAHIALVVQDVETARRRARRHGATWRDAEPLVGVDRGFVVDPDGNLIELIQLA